MFGKSKEGGSLTDIVKEIIDSPEPKSRKVRTTKDEQRFALMWARGEISLREASKAYTKMKNVAHGMGVYVLMARALRDYIRENKI